MIKIEDRETKSRFWIAASSTDALNKMNNKDIDNSLLKIASNSDVVIWDGMYTMQEIKDKKGWGHSSIEDGVIFHKKSKAKKLFISHHAPERSDKDLDSMSKTMLPKGVFFAKENQKIKLT